MEIWDILPRRLQRVLGPLEGGVEELRLRAFQPPSVAVGGRERSLDCGALTPDELWRITEAAAGGSLWSCESQLRRGYLSLSGGARLGICGEVNLEHGEIRSFGEISSLCLRFPREVRGCADGLEELLEGGFENTLIISPPGGGKTTLLRELVRRLSESGVRVGLADERGEVAAMRAGAPQLDVGPMTDVLSGAPKAAAVMSLLRCMSPQVVAFDEITEPEDAAACSSCYGCGVKLLATAHGSGEGDLRRRRLYRGLLDAGIFARCVVIKLDAGSRTYEVREL
ncbi:MAG TPA: stage III sporulation protein AB [Firmicutes bacterium]|nr:stage III sporulation protein AB [Bacillota bacterium]